MKSLKLDPATKDFVFDANKMFSMVDGDDELIQSIQEIVDNNLGEWFVNPEHGFDRFKFLGQKTVTDQMATQELNRSLLQDSRIDHIENVTFNYDRSNRKLSLYFNCIKSDGTTLEVSI